MPRGPLAETPSATLEPAHTAHGSRISILLDHLVGVVSAGVDRWLAVCPCCSERLSVTRAGSDVFVACSHGCPARAIVARLGLRLEDLAT